MKRCGAATGDLLFCSLRDDHDGPHEAWGAGPKSLKVWGRHASDLPVDLRSVPRTPFLPRHAAEGVLA